jgi:hypothetical protein
MLMLFFLIDFDVVYMSVWFDGWTAHCRHHKAYVVRSEYVFEEGKWSCLPESVQRSPRRDDGRIIDSL